MTDVPENPIEQLRLNADNLNSWLDSVKEQIQAAQGYGAYGIERTAKDALDVGWRVAVSLIAGLKQVADALEAKDEIHP